MVDPACVREDQKHGVFVLDDVIEYGGEGAKRHLARILPVLIAAAASDYAGVAQGAVYGIGVAGVTMGEAFAPFADQAVQVRGHAGLCHLPVRRAGGALLSRAGGVGLTELTLDVCGALPRRRWPRL